MRPESIGSIRTFTSPPSPSQTRLQVGGRPGVGTLRLTRLLTPGHLGPKPLWVSVRLCKLTCPEDQWVRVPLRVRQTEADKGVLTP